MVPVLRVVAASSEITTSISGTPTMNRGATNWQQECTYIFPPSPDAALFLRIQTLYAPDVQCAYPGQHPLSRKPSGCAAYLQQMSPPPQQTYLHHCVATFPQLCLGTTSDSVLLGSLRWLGSSL